MRKIGKQYIIALIFTLIGVVCQAPAHSSDIAHLRIPSIKRSRLFELTQSLERNTRQHVSDPDLTGLSTPTGLELAKILRDILEEVKFDYCYLYLTTLILDKSNADLFPTLVKESSAPLLNIQKSLNTRPSVHFSFVW